MKIDSAELRKGLRETRPFLLAHHLPAEFYRCYSPVLFGRRVHVCARCLGVYPGILAGIIVYFFALQEFDSVLVVAVLPLPALVDWSATAFTERRGSNLVRTVTGFFLGCGYGLGIILFLFDATPSILVVGIAYAVLAGALLYSSW